MSWLKRRRLDLVIKCKSPGCVTPNCPGLEVLREFKDWNDLVDHCNEDSIVEWVNKYAEVVEARRYHGKRYRVKQQMLVKAAKELLAPDEIRALVKGVGK